MAGKKSLWVGPSLSESQQHGRGVGTRLIWGGTPAPSHARESWDCRYSFNRAISTARVAGITTGARQAEPQTPPQARLQIP